MHKITNSKILATLDRLHKEASRDNLKLLPSIPRFLLGRFNPEHAKNTHLAISRTQGEFIYNLLIRTGAKNIVEFGTSFGLSTLYLAAAAQQNRGKVITSELLPEKCAKAQTNFETAGIADLLELRQGDALITLATLESNIDFLLLDGWNNLYLPLFRLLENKLNPGAYIYTDNVSFRDTKPLLDYLHSYPLKFESTRLSRKHGDAELTQYVG